MMSLTNDFVNITFLLYSLHYYSVYYASLTMQGYPDDYRGNKEDFSEFYNWARKRCVPIVREITFQNGEVTSLTHHTHTQHTIHTVMCTHIGTYTMLQELTEEGLPFVVLFHHPEDHNSVTQYKQVVESELMEETSEQLTRHNGDNADYPL